MRPGAKRAITRLLGREIEFCHTFFGLGDGGALAFFQYGDEDAYEQLKCQRADRGQHISFKVDEPTFEEICGRIKAADLELRVIDHGYCKSLYVPSPDGLTVEFTIDPPNVGEIDTWQKKHRAPGAGALDGGRPAAKQ